MIDIPTLVRVDHKKISYKWFLHKSCNQLQSSNQLQSNCNPIAIRLQSNCNPTAIQLQPNCYQLQSNCNPTAIQLQSNCNPSAVQLQSICYQLQPKCNQLQSTAIKLYEFTLHTDFWITNLFIWTVSVLLVMQNKKYSIIQFVLQSDQAV